MKTKKIKNLILFVGIVICVALVVFNIIYFIQFHGGLSNNSDDFGNYGAYIGGAISPILNLFTIAILVLTLYIQNKSNQDNIRILGEQLDEEKKKTKITIEHYDKNNIRDNLKSQVLIIEKQMNTSISFQDLIFFTSKFEENNKYCFIGADDIEMKYSDLRKGYLKDGQTLKCVLSELLSSIISNDKNYNATIVFADNTVIQIKNIIRNIINLSHTLSNYINFNISHVDLCIELSTIFEITKVIKKIVDISDFEEKYDYTNAYNFLKRLEEDKINEDFIEYSILNFLEVKKYIWNEMVKLNSGHELSKVSFNEFISNYRLFFDRKDNVDKVINNKEEIVFSLATRLHYAINKKIWIKLINDTKEFNENNMPFGLFMREYIFFPRKGGGFIVKDAKTKKDIFECVLD